MTLTEALDQHATYRMLAAERRRAADQYEAAGDTVTAYYCRQEAAELDARAPSLADLYADEIIRDDELTAILEEIAL